MLTQRIISLRQKTLNRYFTQFRNETIVDLGPEKDTLSWIRENALCFEAVCRQEKPVIDEDDRIVFTRTTVHLPKLARNTVYAKKKNGRPIHESGFVSNICADWGMILARGLAGQRERAIASLMTQGTDPEARDFLESAVITIDAVQELSERYRALAERIGRNDIAEVLSRVPAHPARGFREALQMLRILHSAVWLSGSYHVGFGRFDQYMWPYLKQDLSEGILSEDEAYELLCEFFLLLNRDSDLYPGIQQGDNGQSLMLGGILPDGSDGENRLTILCLEAANELRLIDPKINLRVSEKTNRETLRTAANLTRNGLGFPQYSNDPVVIDGLTRMGYAQEDAANYTVAACWEFIIPGKGMDIVNIGAVSFPSAVEKAVKRCAGREIEGFDSLLEAVREDIALQVGTLVEKKQEILLFPAPWYSVLMTGCIERGRDISLGSTYNNYGIHGAGASNAADSLRSIQKLVYEGNGFSLEHLLDIIERNWEGEESLRQRIVNDDEKVGNNHEQVDTFLTLLYDAFADACGSIKDNGRGGRVRPGSGSAMYYIWLTQERPDMMEPSVGAGADGRKSGDYLSSSLAPSQGTRIRGPISVLRSFSKIDYRKICNGGPVTLELSNAVFASPSGIEKTIELIRVFCELGCQQLQLNTLDPEKLTDAKLHPEMHRNLIVRVWGWSAYFCELSEEYQDHIIARHIFH